MFYATFSIQIWDHPYATTGHGRLVDRFVTCNVKMYGVSRPLFPYKCGSVSMLHNMFFVLARRWKSSKDTFVPTKECTGHHCCYLIVSYFKASIMQR